MQRPLEFIRGGRHPPTHGNRIVSRASGANVFKTSLLGPTPSRREASRLLGCAEVGSRACICSTRSCESCEKRVRRTKSTSSAVASSRRMAWVVEKSTPSNVVGEGS